VTPLFSARVSVRWGVAAAFAAAGDTIEAAASRAKTRRINRT
jgi:hypothetical protein